MLTSRPILTSNITRIFVFFTDDIQSTTPLSFYSISPYSYVTVGTTSDMNYTTLHTHAYTLDFNGVISPVSMLLWTYADNDVNAESKLQISGDGGNTFIDMTDAIVFDPVLYTFTGGAGLWISNIYLGQDGLQLRVLGRSTDGNPATVRLRGDAEMEISLSKQVV